LYYDLFQMVFATERIAEFRVNYGDRQNAIFAEIRRNTPQYSIRVTSFSDQNFRPANIKYWHFCAGGASANRAV